ncbi:MAG: glycosyltransferase family 4 protein [Nitrospinota bacterium]
MQTHTLARLLAERGHEPLVVTFGPEAGERNGDGFRVLYLPYDNGRKSWGHMGGYLGAWRILGRWLRRERPDVLHHVSGVEYFSILTGGLCRRLGIPSLVKYAGDLVWERLAHSGRDLERVEDVFDCNLTARFLGRVERWVFGMYHRIWATSRFQGGLLRDIHRVPDEKIIEFPNLVELPPEAPAPERASKDALEILTVCRFAPWKRVDLTLRVFARLERPGVRLRIVGGENPKLEAELRALAQSLGVADRVDFTGAVSPLHVPDYFRRSDIFCASSIAEPFGIVFVEAMAAGLPVVASAVGGVPEVVPAGRAGFLVPPQDVPAMTARLQQLVDDPALRARQGAYGRQHVRRFDLAAQLDRVLGWYEDLLRTPKTG